ncbi:hypothetical protein AAXE64_27745 [Priestia megaterium]
MVCKAILKKMKKPLVPFAAVTTLSLFTTMKSAEASTWGTLLERGSVKDSPFNKQSIVERGGSIQEFQSFFDKLEKVIDWLVSAGMWVNNLPENVAKMSVDLLANLYQLLLYVLETPLFIFQNSYIKDASLMFSITSILVVSFLSMIQGVKRMFQKKHTDMGTIGRRYAGAVTVSGVAPFAFEQAFTFINMVTRAITKIGGLDVKLGATTNISAHTFTAFNTFALLAFDLVIIALMIPIIMQSGRRFFDLMVLSAITPLALSAWVFDDYRYLFDKWWESVKTLGFSPLVYAVFIALMGIFIFGTKNILTPGGMFLKSIIVIGGLARMANPPNFVKKHVDQGPNMEDSMVNTFNVFRDAYNTLTLKKLRTRRLVGKAINTRKALKAAVPTPDKESGSALWKTFKGKK